MGGIVSRSKQKKTLLRTMTKCEAYPEQILLLRNQIKNKLPITLEDRYVFVLYCPPDYPLESVAHYLHERLGLPIELSTNSPASYFISELVSNELYKDGCIICDYPANIHDLDTLRRHVQSSDTKLVILFFEIDAETLSNVLKKFDRYVHLQSNRSYHLADHPPQSLLANSNLLDDITGEVLVKLPTDTLEGYRNRLREYHLQHIPIYVNFSDLSYIIQGSSTLDESHQNIDRILYKIICQNINDKIHQNQSSSIPPSSQEEERFPTAKTCTAGVTPSYLNHQELTFTAKRRESL
mmetsp:Transcript_4602/g.4620  ORF Transcript_4602/g.4620 Transcript_4602/m.4620 type:complete len:295 (+) Transcript_4602:218-1102(+)